MLPPPDLLRLARLYGAAEGVALSTVGKRAIGDHKVFRRLKEGRATVRTLERLENFFRTEWPGNATWPADIVPAPGGGAE